MLTVFAVDGMKFEIIEFQSIVSFTESLYDSNNWLLPSFLLQFCFHSKRKRMATLALLPFLASFQCFVDSFLFSRCFSAFFLFMIQESERAKVFRWRAGAKRCRR